MAVIGLGNAYIANERDDENVIPLKLRRAAP
jgi:hypothetical protein